MRAPAPCPYPALALAAALLAGCAAPTATSELLDPLRGAGRVEQGYVEMDDGVGIAFTLVLPEGDGPFPTLFEYSAYESGSGVLPRYVERFLPQGYALLGANSRGTGCSGGTFDILSPREARDGAAVVEWAASQEWSDGRVAMLGKSYPGITQWLVAAERPPHLVAIAPGHFLGDIYRDVAYPGGMLNYGFAGGWSFVSQPQYSSEAVAARGADAECPRRVGERPDPERHAYVQARAHPFDDALMRERSPATYVANVTIPAFMVHAFQDEQVGIRGVAMLPDLRGDWRIVLANGDHEMYHAPANAEALDAWLREVFHDGPAARASPRVEVWMEATLDETGNRTPRWRWWTNAWPPPEAAPLTLHLREGGRLDEDAPTRAEAPDAYAYPAPAHSLGARTVRDRPEIDPAALPPLPGTFVAYETGPLASSVLVAGPARLSLALESAADVDVQVTLLEVRPDGRAQHVQKGWLRASHRAVDESRSTIFRPWHPHDREVPLEAGPNVLEIEIPDVAHLFRAGSAIRIEIGTPSTIPEYWAFEVKPGPARPLVHHSPDAPSTLVLPTVPAPPAPPAAACGTVLHQPCREPAPRLPI